MSKSFLLGSALMLHYPTKPHSKSLWMENVRVALGKWNKTVYSSGDRTGAPLNLSEQLSVKCVKSIMVNKWLFFSFCSVSFLLFALPLPDLLGENMVWPSSLIFLGNEATLTAPMSPPISSLNETGLSSEAPSRGHLAYASLNMLRRRATAQHPRPRSVWRDITAQWRQRDINALLLSVQAKE